MPKYVNGAASVPFFRTLFAAFGTGWATAFTNNLAFYSKDSKLLSLKMSALKSVDSSSE